MACGAPTQVLPREIANPTQKIIEVPSEAREIFEKYSSIQPDQVLKHVTQIVGHLPH